MTEAIPAELLSAYRDVNAKQLTRSVIGANIIAMIVVPGGATLDYFLYPEFFYRFLTIRLLDGLFLLAMIGVLMIGRSKPSLLKAKIVGVVSVVSITAAISLMIFETEGAKSPYFAGVNLAIMCFASILPWTVMQTIAMCASTLVIYVVACAANPTSSDASFFPYLGFNVSFILIASTICIGITIFLSRVRFEDFRLRHKLDAQNKELQDLDRLKTQFFSNVSHELRTPLTLILGPVEGLLSRAEGLDKRIHESLLLVHRNTLRLLKLINDLLDLTRLDLGGEVLRKKSTEVGTFLKGVAESVRHLGLSKRLKIRVEEGDPAAEMLVDPARMEKVILNLLTNAIKYTPPGGLITVRWRKAETATDIEVQDTGVGIPAEDLPKVFDRFHQVRSNAANQNQGVGIGLALAKELVEQHGGGISVESVVGTGTTFCVTIPDMAATENPPTIDEAQGVIENTEEPFEKAFRSADRAVRSFTDGAPQELPEIGSGDDRILVADDESDMRQFIVSMLAEKYRVVQTATGDNVLELVAKHEPNLVLLDWMMPGKDGLEVCRELRAKPELRDLKIMLLTARVDEKSKIEALQSGADDFLTKPFSSVEVKTRVANLLDTAKLQKDLRGRNVELQSAVEKLQRTELMLIQSEKMNAIGSLSAGLLHEINNPLNYTLTAVGVARQMEAALDPDMKELVDDIEEGMIRIRDVITDLKSFAYPEKSGHFVTFPIRDAAEDARKIAAKDLLGVEVINSIPGDFRVTAQRTQLTHVFLNLFANAARALGDVSEKERRIEIRAIEEGNRMTVEFADNGPGIPEEIIGRVFEAFFTTKDVGSGMGMGLSICHTIVESHGGTIRVANRPEGGAVFVIEIPAAEMAPAPC